MITFTIMIFFLKATKAHIKLNTKKLYQADWHSVKELVKVTSVLYDAIKTNAARDYDNTDDDIAAVTFDVSAKVSYLTSDAISIHHNHHNRNH